MSRVTKSILFVPKNAPTVKNRIAVCSKMLIGQRDPNIHKRQSITIPYFLRYLTKRYTNGDNTIIPIKSLIYQRGRSIGLFQKSLLHQNKSAQSLKL